MKSRRGRSRFPCLIEKTRKSPDRGKRATCTVPIDIRNITNRENVFNKYYEVELKKVMYMTTTQAPLIPVFNYRVEF